MRRASMLVLLFLAAAHASVHLPSAWASSWDVKLVGGPPELDDFEMALWVNGDDLHENVAYPNNTRAMQYPDYLVLGPPSQRSCYLFDGANFTCLVQCVNKTQCGDSCPSCNSFVPLFSEFDDPQTTMTPGCGGVSAAVLYNVTVLQTTTSVLCFDPTQQRPLFYRRSTAAYSFTASVVAFSTSTSPSDFTVPSYCNCSALPPREREQQQQEGKAERFFSLLLAK